MNAERIRSILKRRPYWGPKSVARELGTSDRVVSVTASRHEINFMDRYEVEAYTDKLVEALEKLEEPVHARPLDAPRSRTGSAEDAG